MEMNSMIEEITNHSYEHHEQSWGVDLNPDISCYELREGNDILLRDVKFYVEGVGIFTVGLIGLGLNALTAAALSLSRTNVNFNRLQLALSVCDILLVVDHIFEMSVVGEFLPSEPRWFGLLWPSVLHPLRGVLQTLNIFILVVSSTERFRAIVYPMERRHSYINYLILCIVGSLLIETPRFFEFQTVNATTGDYWTTELMEDTRYIRFNSYWTDMFITGSLPLIALSYMNFRVYKKIRKSPRFRSSALRNSRTQRMNNSFNNGFFNTTVANSSENENGPLNHSSHSQKSYERGGGGGGGTERGGSSGLCLKSNKKENNGRNPNHHSMSKNSSFTSLFKGFSTNSSQRNKNGGTFSCFKLSVPSTSQPPKDNLSNNKSPTVTSQEQQFEFNRINRRNLSWKSPWNGDSKELTRAINAKLVNGGDRNGANRGNSENSAGPMGKYNCETSFTGGHRRHHPPRLYQTKRSRSQNDENSVPLLFGSSHYQGQLSNGLRWNRSTGGNHSKHTGLLTYNRSTSDNNSRSKRGYDRCLDIMEDKDGMTMPNQTSLTVADIVVIGDDEDNLTTINSSNSSPPLAMNSKKSRHDGNPKQRWLCTSHNWSRKNTLAPHMRSKGSEKSTLILVSIVLCFLICHCYRLSLRMYEMLHAEKFTHTNFTFCNEQDRYHIPVLFFILICINNIFVVLNSSINFFIYFAIGKEFRVNVKRILRLKQWSTNSSQQRQGNNIY